MSLYCVVAPMAGTHGVSHWNDAKAGWRAGRARATLSVHLVRRPQVTETTFTFRVDEALKAAFTEAARAHDRPGSQLLRDFMRDYVEKAEHDA
jgi:hypothetical protein